MVFDIPQKKITLMGLIKFDYYKNFIIFLVLSIYPLAITGPFLPDLFLVISSLLLIIISIYEKNYKIFNNKYIYGFYFFYIIILTSTILSDHLLLSLESSLFYFRFFFLIYLFSFCFNQSDKFGYYFFLVLCFIFIILYFDSFIQILTGTNLIGYSKFENDWRISSFFGDDLKLGSYLSRLFPILICFSLLIKKLNKAIFFLIISSITLFIVLHTGERAALIILVSNIILIFLFSSKIFNTKFRLFLIMLFSIIAILLSFSSNNIIVKNLVYERVVEKSINQMNELFFSEEKKNSFDFFTSSHHLAIYKTAFKIFRQNYIIGAGPKVFRELCNEQNYRSFYVSDSKKHKVLFYNKDKPLRWVDHYPEESKVRGGNDKVLKSSLYDFFENGCQTHPHHTYIQLASETGLIGLILFVIFVIVILFLFIKTIFMKLFKNVKNTDFMIIILGSVLINFNPLVPSGSFFNNWLNIMYYLPIALLFNINEFKQSNEKN
jgi:O-antigen ligase